MLKNLIIWIKIMKLNKNPKFYSYGEILATNECIENCCRNWEKLQILNETTKKLRSLNYGAVIKRNTFYSKK